MNEIEALKYLKSIAESLESIKKIEFENREYLNEIKMILKYLADKYE